MKKRSSEETATIVESTIREIRSKSSNLSKKNVERLISSTCLANQINEEHIRRVAGWTN